MLEVGMVGRSPSLSNSSTFEQGHRPFFEALARELPTPGAQLELQSILQDADPAALFSDLLNFARRLRVEEKFEWAAELFAWLGGQEGAPQEIKDRAKREADAIQGKGAFGLRAEFLLTQILKDSVDPKLILPMMGASIIGSLSKTIAMGRILRQPAMLLTRGTGAKLLAGAAGFGVEGFAFAALGRGFSKGPKESFGSDLARSYVGLGALKFSGWAGNRLGEWSLGRTPGTGAFQAMHRGVVPQLSMFAGMLMAHKLETHWGLRPETNSDSLVVDTLAAMISLQLGTKLGHEVLGKEFQYWQQSQGLRSEEGSGSSPWAQQLAHVPPEGFQSHLTPEGVSFSGILFSKGGGSSKGQKDVESKPILKSKQPQEVLELVGEFRIADLKKWSEAEIDEMVKAIVAQDKELYPEGNAAMMSASRRYFGSHYRINGIDLTLHRLTGGVRQARGLKSHDKKSLSDPEILIGWQARLFGIDVVPRAHLVLMGDYSITNSKRWTEAEIDQVLKAIVAQDGELYPEGKADSMSAAARFVNDRWYRVNGKDLTLNRLLGRVRQARGLKVSDTKSLPSLEIIREWKQRLFGIEGESRANLVIVGNFPVANPKRWTEEEIDQVVKAIVAQDGELYPKGNAAVMSSSGTFLRDPWYRVNGEDLTLNKLLRRVRRARGLRTSDTKSLSDPKIIQDWKRRLFGIEVEETTGDILELTGEHFISDPKRWTEQEIDHVVKAIVMQDGELYPKGSATDMSSAKRFVSKKYQINGRKLSLNKLAGKVRQTKGMKADDTKSLPTSEVIQEWKNRLFGIEGKFQPDLVLVGEYSHVDPKRLTEEEIDRIVKAIVAQDGEIYPEENATEMSVTPRYLDRWYRVGSNDLTIGILMGRVRQARGLKTNDTGLLPDSAILREWKRRLFGVEVKEAVRDILELTGEYFISDPKKWTEQEIDQVVKAIVTQDRELYPEGNAAAMSTSSRYFIDSWYRVNGKELTVNRLTSYVRQARGLKRIDTKSLPDSEILRDWKFRLFGIEEKSRANLVLAGEFHFADPKRWTEEEIDQVVKAIVAQDRELYPEGSVAAMSSSPRFFTEQWYRVNGEDLTLNRLAGRVRRARGLSADSKESLPPSEIIREWKWRLFGIGRGLQADLILAGEFPVADPERWTEEEIYQIVKAIVSQDKERYPEGNAAFMSNSSLSDRWYWVNGEDLTLNRLAGRVRQARGLKKGDVQVLRSSEIVREWKLRLGVMEFNKLSVDAIEDFVRQANLQPLLDLFSEDPAQLIEALSFLKREEFKNKDVTEFVKAYVGLQVEGIKGGQAKIELDPWERRKKYIQAILQALETGENLDLSEVNFSNQLSLLIRLSRKSFEEAPGKLIEELERLAAQPAHPFVQKLQAEAASYFRAASQFDIQGMRSRPYGYQREGAHFLATHDRAILADEAGMGKSYQVIAAAESLDLKRILWVTTASNKETLREEILQHSLVKLQDVKVVISGDPKERKEQLRSLNGERYIITNYETLVALQKGDPEAYAKLTSGLDVVVVDEAQLTDNADTLRTKAIHDIPAKRRWLLTATPYQSRPEKMWTVLNWLEAEKYPEFNAFKQMYTQSTQGLILLHSELAKLMLRRTKQDTLYIFKDPHEIPFERQLTDGIPRLPQKRRLAPEAGGIYSLSPEQSDLIAWMTADFKGWAEHFNAHLPNGSEPIDLENINALLKFDTIQKVIYEPGHFGIESENPIFKALDQRVANRLAKGEKIILWAWNTSMVDALEKRYQQLGVRRIDGGVIGQAREAARHDFQENPGVRILVANYQSGGVGLTLTAAHSAIFVQLPQVFPTLYQAEGRHQRLIGMNNLRHAKAKVEVEWMVPRFPKGFVEGIEDPKLAQILKHGTLVEQTRSRLEGGETLYHLLMEGYGKFEDLENYFKAGLIQGMGLSRSDKLDYVSHLKGEMRNYAEVAQSLLPLWIRTKGDPEGELKVLRLVEAFKDNPPLAQKTGTALQHSTKVYFADLEFLISLFHLKNKYIRQQMLTKAPDLLETVYRQGKSLSEATEGLKLGKLSPASFLAQVYLSSGAGGRAIGEITRALGQTRDTPVKRYLEEHFFTGVLGIVGNKTAERILAEKEALFADSNLLPHQIHAVYRLGLLARTRPDLLEGLAQKFFDQFTAFSKALETTTNQAIAEFAGRSVESVEAMITANPEWQGSADLILALLAGYREFSGNEADALQGQFREAIGHLLDGDYREWRQNSENGIDYLAGEPSFWDAFAKNQQHTLGPIRVSSQKVHATLVKDYLSLITEYGQEGEAVEGKWVKAELEAYRAADPKTKAEILGRYQEEQKILGKSLGAGEVGEGAKSLFEKYQVPTDPGLTQKAILQEKLTELRNLISWIQLDRGFQSLGKGQAFDQANIVKDLDAKVRYYRSRKYDKMAEHWETLKEAVSRYNAGEIGFKDVTIEDTDDPAILMRMGAIHPELVNCFNPNGNPVFNQFVVAALGSKNMKMVVVREEGKIVALAMAKVKRLADGTPVLFLERGIYRKGYDFRKEMLDHLQKRASEMTPKPIVMTQIEGKIRPEDPEVYGTGAYTGSEYVEPVFALRKADYTKHRGRIVTQEIKKADPEVQAAPVSDSAKPWGIGTASLSMESYIQQLQAQGIKTVVDVRAQPFSRFRPHFNRDRMAVLLKAAGIEYVWLGEKLGNPKDAKGERTLVGFQSYMKTPGYAQGLTQLRDLIQKSPGRVALTCAEAEECDCHRKFILQDLGRDK